MKKLITEKDIIDFSKNGSKDLYVEKGTLITSLAFDKIKSLKITIKYDLPQKNIEKVEVKNFLGNLRIAIGADHTGFATKKTVIEFLEKKGYKIEDVGTSDEKSCDYPDFAYLVAKKVALKEVDFGVLLDATGIPSAITANKVPTIRAATCYNEFTARSAREHNNANIIVMGAKTLGEELIKSILETWLQSSFLGDRHQRRLDKITDIEKAFFKEIN